MGYNISDDNSCGFAKTGSAKNGDMVNPMLAVLANNGGPTQTIALQANSPAIDAIPFASCTYQALPPNRLATDQRGFGRPDPGMDPADPVISAPMSPAIPRQYRRKRQPRHIRGRQPRTHADANPDAEGYGNRHPQTRSYADS
jgi:hypothetical protein